MWGFLVRSSLRTVICSKILSKILLVITFCPVACFNNCSEVLQKKHKVISHFIGLSCVGMDSDQKNLVSCQFFWPKFGGSFQSSIWHSLGNFGQQNISRSLAIYMDRGYLISSCCHLSSLLSQAIELLCLQNQKMSLIRPWCEKFSFFCIPELNFDLEASYLSWV